MVLLAAWLSASAASADPALGETPAPPPTLMRFPNSHGNRIVFVAHGNLWTVAGSGGSASRLTSDSGRDAAPRYSPDGRWIAFTASYQRNQDVYVIPAGGGEARRLTFSGGNGPGSASGSADNLVVTWTPDSQAVVFLSGRSSWNRKITRLYRVPVDGGLPTALPLDHAGLMSYGPNDHIIAYTRIFYDFDAWKRYDGGQAPDLYTYDFDTRKLDRITDWKGTDTAPMWFGRRIYFLSDRDARRRANLWVYDQDTGQTRAVTHFTGYDIDFPSLGTNGDRRGTITFQQGGKLWAIDLPSERMREVRVEVPDDGVRTGIRYVDAKSAIRAADIAGNPDYALSPDGARAAFSARGDIFIVPTGTAPAGPGPVRNLTRTSDADEDHPAWSPDGKLIAYMTDASGEQQIAIRPADGGPERRLTRFRTGYFYAPVWSPDGRTLAVADANHRLWLVGIDAAEPRQVAQDAHREIHDAAFSPDGRWLAFSLQRENQQLAIHLHEIATGHDTVVSSPMNSDSHPLFSADGRYLIFVSKRHELPVLSDSETNVATLKSDGIYVATLRDGSASPFGTTAAVPEKHGTGAGTGTQAVPVPLRIDLDGLMRRVVPLPIPPADIGAIDVRGDRIFYRTRPPKLIDGDLPGEASVLHAYDLRAHADETIVEGLDDDVLSADGSRVLYERDKEWHVADARSGQGRDARLPLDGMRARIDPRQEWREMFGNVWRLDRDLFFSAAMNGDDWQAMHDAYASFLPLLGSRSDLNYLLTQLQGELGNSHMFIRGGGDDDQRMVSAPTKFLGVDYALDAASGRYRFAKIYGGDGSRPEERSPLAAPGIDVHENDVLLAVDGHALRAPVDPDSLFVGLDGPVTLTVAKAADGVPHEVVVDPISSEMALREHDWIEHNRQKVDRLSGGRIAYVYLPDFQDLGTRQFVRQFYPQIDKQALIVDVRYNAGGFTSQLVLERLRRMVIGRYVNRERGTETLPDEVLDGPKVTIINHYSASDGDQFPYFFRQYGLGQVIGSRTWGGVRGIAGPWRLLDGGFVTVPKDALYSPQGNWIIENHGVDPDIEVEDVPGEYLDDHDVQLETGVRMLIDQLDHHPTVIAPPPALLPAYPPDGEVPPGGR